MNIFLTYFIPIITLLIPLIFLGYLSLRKGKPLVDKYQVSKIGMITMGLFIIIFAGLSYLSSGVNTYFMLDAGKIQFIEGTIEWNITEHLRFSLPIYTAMNLLAVSMLSAHLYASMIVLPKICEVPKSKLPGSSLSAITSGASALAGSAVCCSTSLIAVITPAFSVIIGPFIPGLWIFSQAILGMSYYRIVLPRIPFSIVIGNI